MKKNKRVIAALLAGLLILSFAACRKEEAEQPQLPEEPVQEELPQEQPEVEAPKKEQASLVDSNLMLSRLKDNLEAPLSTAARLKEDSSVKTDLTPELLNEISGFLCQNFTVLRYTAAVDLSNCLYLQIIGDKEIHDVYVTQWTDSERETHTFVQVEEEGMMGQYIYDKTTYPAMMELLESWEYENTMTVSGEYQPLTTTEYLQGLQDGSYRLNQLYQYGDQLILELESDAMEGCLFEFIDADSGDTVQTIALPKKALDVRSTSLEGYDFYIMTEDSIHYRSAEDFGLKLDFGLPQSVKDKLLKNVDEPLFDVDYIQDLLVYVSDQGVVLSNQSGKRNDLLLKHERLIELLNLNAEEEKRPLAQEKEELTAYYAAPQLMNNGKIIVCPILLRGEVDQWVGCSVFNLMNGSFKDYVEEFDHIDRFSYPDEQTILTLGEESYTTMDVLTREFSSQEWSSKTNETAFLCSRDRLLTWRKGMEYSNELLLSTLGTEATSLLLSAQGDRFMVHGATEDYALISWSDSQGDMMAVVSLFEEKEPQA